MNEHAYAFQISAPGIRDVAVVKSNHGGLQDGEIGTTQAKFEAGYQARIHSHAEKKECTESPRTNQTILRHGPGR